MGGKSKTQLLTDSILGQHLALSVAAHLARTQLVPEPLADTPHGSLAGRTTVLRIRINVGASFSRQ